jgi:hypothetical protein
MREPVRARGRMKWWEIALPLALGVLGAIAWSLITGQL